MGNLKGLGLFSLEICALISEGHKETLVEIEKHLDNADLIEYIAKKYKESMTIRFDTEIYDNRALNKYFSNFS